jgi:hypothetical protein
VDVSTFELEQEEHCGGAVDVSRRSTVVVLWM